MRSILENVSAYDLLVKRGLRYETSSLTLTGNIVLPPDGPVVYQLNTGGVARTVTLPPIVLTGIGPPNAPPANEGRLYRIWNNGTAGNLTLNAAAGDGGATVATISPGQIFDLQIINQAWQIVSSDGGNNGGANLPTAQVVTNNTAGATTAAVGDLTGAQACTVKLTAVGAANYTTRTATQMFADMPNAAVGMSWMVYIKNTNAGTTTVVGGVGVTLNGSAATVAQNTTRIYVCTFTSATALTMESLGVTSGA